MNTHSHLTAQTHSYRGRTRCTTLRKNRGHAGSAHVLPACAASSAGVGRVKKVEVHCNVEAMAERRRKRSREEERTGRAGR